MQRQVVPVSAVLSVLASSCLANAASFQGLDIPAYYGSRATALSPDGSVVMGEMWAPGMPEETFRWTTSGGLTRQADLAGWGGFGWPHGMSYDGGVVIGYDTNPGISGGHAFTWTSGGGRAYLDDPAQVDQSEPWAISWDGATVAGYRVRTGETRFEAVVWQNGSAQLLGQTFGDQETLATGVSSTGTVVGQTSEWPGPARPFRWTAQAGIQFIDLPETVRFEGGPRVSADGNTIAGDWWPQAGGDESFVWTEQSGAIGLGDLPGGAFSSHAAGLSADGQIVVGTSITGSYSPAEGFFVHSTTAFIWDKNHGMRSLPAVLADEYGLDLRGWALWEATGISADGRTIVGNGVSPDGYWQTWIAQVPEPSTGVFLLMSLALFRHRRRRFC